jgi:hypothetical protein
MRANTAVTENFASFSVEKGTADEFTIADGRRVPDPFGWKGSGF